jgi:hypothetical protein
MMDYLIPVQVIFFCYNSQYHKIGPIEAHCLLGLSEFRVIATIIMILMPYFQLRRGILDL